MKKIYCYPGLCFLFLCTIISCKKGTLVQQDNYAQVNISYYHPDTATYVKAFINNNTILHRENYSYDDQFNNLFFFDKKYDSARLQIIIFKNKPENKFIFDKTVALNANINTFRLCQICPNQTPIIIPSVDTTKPPPVSRVKTRFFFSTNDNISNSKSPQLNKKVTTLLLQVFTFTPNADTTKPPDSLKFVANVRVAACALSGYINLDRDKKYAFRVRDLSKGVPSSSNIMQDLNVKDVALIEDLNTGNQVWNFRKGIIFFDGSDMEKKFQTFRLKIAPISYQDDNGDIIEENVLNAQYIFAQNDK
jgi:hypothetical protein